MSEVHGRLARSGMMAVALTFLVSSKLLAAEDNDIKAQECFYKAVELFKNGKYKEALEQFKESYSLKPQWKLRYNIGLSYYLLDDKENSAEQLSAFLEAGEENQGMDKQMEEAKSLLASLKAELGILQLSGISKDATVIIDDKLKEEVKAGKQIFLKPGKHLIKIVMGDQKFVEIVTIDPGVIKEVHVKVLEVEKKKDANELEPAKKGANEPGPKKTVAGKAATLDIVAEKKGMQESDRESAALKKKKGLWIGGWAVLGGACGLLIAGTVAGGFVLHEQNLIEDTEKKYRQLFDDASVTDDELYLLYDKRDDQYHRAKDYAVAANALLATGAVLTAAAVVLLVVSRNKREARTDAKKAALAHLRLLPGMPFLRIDF
jgi:tetratricopeptide (TPR) repeat protein